MSGAGASDEGQVQVQRASDAASRWRMRHACRSSANRSRTGLGCWPHHEPKGAPEAASYLGDQDTASARPTRARLAMFNLAINSKLRGRDLVRLRLADVVLGGTVRLRTSIIQQKTGRPVPFELTEPTRAALTTWLSRRPTATGDRPSSASTTAIHRHKELKAGLRWHKACGPSKPTSRESGSATDSGGRMAFASRKTSRFIVATCITVASFVSGCR